MALLAKDKSTVVAGCLMASQHRVATFTTPWSGRLWPELKHQRPGTQPSNEQVLISTSACN